MRGTRRVGRDSKQVDERMRPITELLEQTCEAEDHDPGTLRRTFDMYTVVPEGFSTQAMNAEVLDMTQPVMGTSEEIAEHILSVGELGFEEVRCDVFPKTIAAIEAMQPVVEFVHAG
jgi:hypothetical protein